MTTCTEYLNRSFITFALSYIQHKLVYYELYGNVCVVYSTLIKCEFSAHSKCKYMLNELREENMGFVALSNGLNILELLALALALSPHPPLS